MSTMFLRPASNNFQEAQRVDNSSNGRFYALLSREIDIQADRILNMNPLRSWIGVGDAMRCRYLAEHCLDRKNVVFTREVKKEWVFANFDRSPRPPWLRLSSPYEGVH